HAINAGTALAQADPAHAAAAGIAARAMNAAALAGFAPDAGRIAENKGEATARALLSVNSGGVIRAVGHAQAKPERGAPTPIRAEMSVMAAGGGVSAAGAAEVHAKLIRAAQAQASAGGISRVIVHAISEPCRDAGDVCPGDGVGDVSGLRGLRAGSVV